MGEGGSRAQGLPQEAQLKIAVPGANATMMQSATLAELIERLHSGSATESAEALADLATQDAGVVAPALRDVLIKTTEARVRNAVALALSDLRDRDSFELLVGLIKSRETSGARGTLLYALAAYDCSSILPLLVDCVIEGGFEEAHEALGLITAIETQLDDETWRACTERLRAALIATTEERRPLVQELLELFDQ